jgi:transposase, IS5 family
LVTQNIPRKKEQALRKKTLEQEYLDFSFKSTLKVVREYRTKYEGIGEILEANAGILDIAHGDFSRSLSQSEYGRGGYTSEQILRSIVVMFIEEKSYRDAVIMVENSEFLRNFIKLGNKAMMDFTFLCKAYAALSEQTWKAINEALSGYAKKQEKITAEKLRLDTTAYETNIHYPTDSSLLWDGYRTLARLMREAREELRVIGVTHRFHTKKVRKLALYISRNSHKKEKGVQRKIKSTYRKLIERAQGIVSVGKAVLKLLSGWNRDAVTAKLKHYLPIAEKITGQAERRVILGEQVPSAEKVYSLFEEHTELIKRGKAGKPIEFGHKVLLVETGEKFIIHYEAMPKQRADTELIQQSLSAHNRVFGCRPDVLAGDKGFYESREQIGNLSREIDTVSICKKGRRTEEEDHRESTEEFKAGQRFRAGIEGTISVLKRAFKLSKCLFKGFRNFASSVGCAVFCHNLVMLART